MHPIDPSTQTLPHNTTPAPPGTPHRPRPASRTARHPHGPAPARPRPVPPGPLPPTAGFPRDFEAHETGVPAVLGRLPDRWRHRSAYYRYGGAIHPAGPEPVPRLPRLRSHRLHRGLISTGPPSGRWRLRAGHGVEPMTPSTSLGSTPSAPGLAPSLRRGPYPCSRASHPALPPLRIAARTSDLPPAAAVTPPRPARIRRGAILAA
jgi:hypothetical protein